MDTKTIRILKTLSTGLVIVAMIFAFLIAGIRIFGVQVYGVLTGSMEPTHPTGSLIYVKRTDASDLRVNDVITFSISPNVIATHRIVEIVPDENNPSIVRYRTKGDANKDVDASLVSASNIIGKVVFSVPQLGYVANFIQQPPGIYVAILVCGLMIAFVFYTDSLENKQKASFQRSTRRGHASQNRSRSPQASQQNKYARQSQASREGDYSRHSAYSSQNGYRQSGYQQQSGYAQQSGYYRQNEYPQQNAYPRQSGYQQQNGYAQQSGYPRQSAYPQQNGYPRQNGYAQQRTYQQQNEYPQQRAHPQQSDESQKREYSQPRDSRTGRM